MKSPLLLSAAAALLALAACNSESKPPEVVDSNPDPMASELANAAPVELPAAIKVEKSFRCKDNSVVYVTLFEGDKQAAVRTSKDGPATTLKSASADEPRTAEGGWSLTGDAKGITLAQPGKDSQTCKG